MEDKQIVEMYFARDERAIKETDGKYGTFCHSIAMNILSVREDAEECVNDTYYAVWEKIPPTIPQCFAAFLGRITRNLSISRFRVMRAKKRYSGMEVMLSELEECIPAHADVERIVEASELAELISEWLESLSKRDCALFVKRYWFGEKVQDLALAAGITEAQMAQLMLKLRRSLKATLEKKGVAI